MFSLHLQLCPPRHVISVCLTEVMDEVADTVPGLEKIVAEIEGLASSGGNYRESPHVIEVTLPMLCRSVVIEKTYLINYLFIREFEHLFAHSFTPVIYHSGGLKDQTM